jgi:hypothetical protein
MQTSEIANGVTPRQAIIIDQLASGLTITKAADRGGVARKTIYNWLETEAFQAALAARRKELADRLTDRVAELGGVAITTLMDVLQTDEEVAYTRKTQAELAERLLNAMGILNASKPSTDKSQSML